MHRSRRAHTGAAIAEAILRRYPLTSLLEEDARGLAALGVHEADSGEVDLSALTSGRERAAVVVASDVPDPLPAGLAMVVLGPGERREVLLGGGGLADLPDGTPVSVPSPRHAALLRALHPGLDPVASGTAPTHAIAPLWVDPGMEARGELLERDSWLPGPGDGIPVLLLSPGMARTPSGDPGATGVLLAERALARTFSGALVSVRGQAFAGQVRLHALLVSTDGRRAVRGDAQGPLDRPEEVADALASLLEARGARLISAGSGT